MMRIFDNKIVHRTPFQGENIMRILVTYDISNARRLRRIAKVTVSFGTRVQKSVFECDLEEGGFIKLKERLAREMNPELDSVRFYRLCGRCRTAIEVMGTGPIVEEPGAIIV